MLIGLLCSLSSLLHAQSLDHPIIWITQKEKATVLGNISNYDWAKSLNSQLHSHVDARKKDHVSNPGKLLNTIPALGRDRNKHNEILILATESGMLYFLTGDETYAQMSADILSAYTLELATKEPRTVAIGGDPFMDGRTTYPQLALLYDFTYPFLKKPDTRVYDKGSKTRKAFDNRAAQKAFMNIAGNILQEYGGPDVHGRVVSNHPILTAPGALFPILCIEDDAERERLFDVFWNKGTKHQASFKHTILPL